MSTDVLWRWRNILVCTLWPVFYQAVGGDGGKDKNKEGKVEEVVFMLTCWLEGKGFMWSVVKSNAIAQDPTSAGCIPLVFSFSAPIVSPLFSFSFYLLLSLALTSLESQEICSFSFILCLHLLQSIAQHVPKLPFFYTWYECCTGERASKWLSDFSSICHTLSCHLSNCTYTFRMH